MNQFSNLTNSVAMKKSLMWLPVSQWGLGYQKRWLRGDLVAGITVAMMLIPQAMSYALLAGLPPIIGLYASIVPLIIYAIFGTSRQLAVGPVAMVALLVASGVGAIAEPGSQQFVFLAITLAMMVGVIQLAMGVFRLGFLTNFMSHPVISGFTSAAAIIIGLSQLKHVLGVDLPRTENAGYLLWLAAEQLLNSHWPSLIIGVSGIGLLVLLKRVSPLIPGPMVAVVLSTLLVYWFGLDQQGVKIVGDVPPGLPSFSVPDFNYSQLSALFPIALTISFVGFMESIAVAKKIAAEKKYELDANMELVGLGLANIFGAFFKAMPVTGGFSRTAVNNNAGANTGLAAIITAVLIALALMFFTPLFFFIPKAILGSIIMVAVYGLIDWQEVKHLWQVKKEDLILLLLTFFATLTLGVMNGIIAGIAVSMIWFVVKTTRPHYAILGKLPESNDYRNVHRYATEEFANLLIIRFDAQFYYGNVSFLKETLKKYEQQKGPELSAIVIDASSINQLDSSADTALHELLDSYQTRQIQLHFANVKGPVRDVMKKSGFWQRLGADHFHFNVHQAVMSARSPSAASASISVS